MEGDQGQLSISSTLPSALSLSERLLAIELELVSKLKSISIPPPVTYIYSPLDYAFEPHADYVRKYAKTQKKILFLGMNPG